MSITGDFSVRNIPGGFSQGRFQGHIEDFNDHSGGFVGHFRGFQGDVRKASWRFRQATVDLTHWRRRGHI